MERKCRGADGGRKRDAGETGCSLLAVWAWLRCARWTTCCVCRPGGALEHYRLRVCGRKGSLEVGISAGRRGGEQRRGINAMGQKRQCPWHQHSIPAQCHNGCRLVLDSPNGSLELHLYLDYSLMLPSMSRGHHVLAPGPFLPSASQLDLYSIMQNGPDRTGFPPTFRERDQPARV
jgi:hypothetical protein